MPRVLSFALLTVLSALAIAGCGKKDTDSDSPSSGGGGGGASPRPIIGAQTDEARKQTARRLRDIGIALHSYHDANAVFPAGIVGPNGQLGLSWRVAILPYLEEDNLYKQFKLDEPWDSDHNKKFIAKMPKVFEAPSAISSNGKTFYRSFAGPSAFFQTPPANPKGPANPPSWAGQQPGMPARGRVITSIVDGTSNTLMLAEAAEPIEWTKPEELPFPDQPGTTEKPRGPVPKLGGIFTGGFYGVLCDGSVRFFPDTMSAQDMRRLIWVNDGEVFTMPGTEVQFPREKPVDAEEGDPVPPARPGTNGRK